MKTYKIDITTTARAVVTVRAPNDETAYEYVKSNFDGYGLEYEIDEMSAEVDAGYRTIELQPGVKIPGHPKVWGVTEFDLAHPDIETDYTVDTEWLTENGYEVITTIRKRENV